MRFCEALFALELQYNTLSKIRVPLALQLSFNWTKFKCIFTKICFSNLPMTWRRGGDAPLASRQSGSGSLICTRCYLWIAFVVGSVLASFCFVRFFFFSAGSPIYIGTLHKSQQTVRDFNLFRSLWSHRAVILRKAIWLSI